MEKLIGGTPGGMGLAATAVLSVLPERLIKMKTTLLRAIRYLTSAHMTKTLQPHQKQLLCIIYKEEQHAVQRTQSCRRAGWFADSAFAQAAQDEPGRTRQGAWRHFPANSEIRERQKPRRRQPAAFGCHCA